MEQINGFDIPPHAGGISISHNDCHGVYQTVAQEFSHSDDYYRDDCFLPGDKEVCADTESLWIIQWYPNTPVGHFTAFGSTLENALTMMQKIQEGE